MDSTASRIHTAVNHTVAVAADTCLVQCRIEPCVEVGMDSSMVVVGSDPGRALVHPMAAAIAVAVEEEPDAWNAVTVQQEDSCKSCERERKE